MMTLDYVGDEGAMVNAQVGHHPLARTTETSPKRRRGTLSCLSARPPDLADAAITRPRVVAVFLSTVPFVLQARGGDATPRFALWAMHRFVRSLTPLVVEQPGCNMPIHDEVPDKRFLQSDTCDLPINWESNETLKKRRVS